MIIFDCGVVTSVFMLRAVGVTLVGNCSQLLRIISSRPAVHSLTSARVYHHCSMELQLIVTRLHEMFPPSLAENWDNVGLLVEPSSKEQPVNHIMMTNDLTEDVMDEVQAASPQVGLIIAYHPPIFKPLKSLTRRTVKERIILKAVESRIAIYSPHTAADSVYDGVNDWLAAGLGEGECTPLQPTAPLYEVRAEHVSSEVCEMISDDVAQCGGKPVKRLRDDSYEVLVKCRLDTLPQVYTLLCGKVTSQNISISQVAKENTKGSGVGRKLILNTPVHLSKLVVKVKNYLGLPSVRLARGRTCEDSTMVTSVAICAGSGATVLRGTSADVYLTGEMSHHEVLDATSRGTSVILCEHSNTERGYLAKMKDNLQQALGSDVKISLSLKDHDPLVFV